MFILLLYRVHIWHTGMKTEFMFAALGVRTSLDYKCGGHFHYKMWGGGPGPYFSFTFCRLAMPFCGCSAKYCGNVEQWRPLNLWGPILSKQFEYS